MIRNWLTGLMMLAVIGAVAAVTSWFVLTFPVVAFVLLVILTLTVVAWLLGSALNG